MIVVIVLSIKRNCGVDVLCELNLYTHKFVCFYKVISFWGMVRISAKQNKNASLLIKEI